MMSRKWAESSEIACYFDSNLADCGLRILRNRLIAGTLNSVLWRVKK